MFFILLNAGQTPSKRKAGGAHSACSKALIEVSRSKSSWRTCSCAHRQGESTVTHTIISHRHPHRRRSINASPPHTHTHTTLDRHHPCKAQSTITDTYHYQLSCFVAASIPQAPTCNHPQPNPIVCGWHAYYQATVGLHTSESSSLARIPCNSSILQFAVRSAGFMRV